MKNSTLGYSENAHGDDVLTIVSTETLDRIQHEDDHTVTLTRGGPATYLSSALSKLSFPYRLISGPVARVEVKVGARGELYSIPTIPLIPLPRAFPGAVILSPIMREIDPASVPDSARPIIIDLQGFVRKPSNAYVHWPPGSFEALLRRASIVKGSNAEVNDLRPGERAGLEDGLLLITQGVEGADIVHGTDKMHIPARSVSTTTAIGAGDTFLAAFTVEILRGTEPFKAGEMAARFTEEILRARGSRHDQT